MKSDVKEFNGVEYVLLIPDTLDELEIVRRFGGKNAPVSGIVREIEQNGKVGHYLRLTIPPSEARSTADILKRIPVNYCESCNAPILWLRNNKTGKPAPIDAPPSENGNCKVYSETHYQVLAGEGLKNARSLKSLLNTSHFFTCPEADKFKRQGK